MRRIVSGGDGDNGNGVQRSERDHTEKRSNGATECAGSTGVAKRRARSGLDRENEHGSDQNVLVFTIRSVPASGPATQADPSNLRVPLRLSPLLRCSVVKPFAPSSLCSLVCAAARPAGLDDQRSADADGHVGDGHLVEDLEVGAHRARASRCRRCSRAGCCGTGCAGCRRASLPTSATTSLPSPVVEIDAVRELDADGRRSRVR